MTDSVQPFITALYRDEHALREARALLSERWEEVDFESPPFPFNVTDYYEREMGPGLLRIFWSFPRLVFPDALPDWKRFTVEVEGRLAVDGRRRVNLDPGYLDPCKVVLASLKYNGPKVYLRDGVYADVILLYDQGHWKPTPWCFADFRDGRYADALSKIRARMRMKCKGAVNP